MYNSSTRSGMYSVAHVHGQQYAQYIYSTYTQYTRSTCPVYMESYIVHVQYICSTVEVCL